MVDIAVNEDVKWLEDLSDAELRAVGQLTGRMVTARVEVRGTPFQFVTPKAWNALLLMGPDDIKKAARTLLRQRATQIMEKS